MKLVSELGQQYRSLCLSFNILSISMTFTKEMRYQTEIPNRSTEVINRYQRGSTSQKGGRMGAVHSMNTGPWLRSKGIQRTMMLRSTKTLQFPTTLFLIGSLHLVLWTLYYCDFPSISSAIPFLSHFLTISPVVQPLKFWRTPVPKSSLHLFL